MCLCDRLTDGVSNCETHPHGRRDASGVGLAVAESEGAVVPGNGRMKLQLMLLFLERQTSRRKCDNRPFFTVHMCERRVCYSTDGRRGAAREEWDTRFWDTRCDKWGHFKTCRALSLTPQTKTEADLNGLYIGCGRSLCVVARCFGSVLV